MTALKILLLDIETSPLTAHIWRPTDQYVPMDRLQQDSFMINWGAKWVGEEKVTSGLVTSKEALMRDDSRIVPPLADLIRKADYAVGHNINGFDLPKINARVAGLDLEPLGPVRTIDTLQLAKKNLQIAYNKLDYLGEYFGLGRKIKTDMELWLRCLRGETQALREMRAYNVQDVHLLEAVMEKLKPHCRNFPRLFDADHQDERLCLFCGGTFETMQRRGYYRTQASTMVKFQCVNVLPNGKICGKYSRARSTERGKRPSVYPL